MSSVPSLQVQVHTPSNEEFQGRCTDLDSHLGDVVALVEFGSQRAPEIPLGETARLTLSGDGFAAPIETEVIAVLRTESRTRRCYSFRMKRVSKRLLMLLANRRGSDRVVPPAAKPVCVNIVDDGEAPAEAIVHDISATGLSILVEPALEKRLCNRVQLRLSILLPDAGTVNASATIRHRRLFGSAVLYGLEFDGQIPGFMSAQERLLSYLASLRSPRS